MTRAARLAVLAGVLALSAAAGPTAANPVTGKPWLGIVMSPGSGKYGVEVVSVYRGAPADLAGVKAGDEILAVDGQRVRSNRALVEILQTNRVIGDEVEVKLLRGDHTLSVTAVLGRGPTDEDILRLRLLNRPAPDFELPALQQGKAVQLARHQGDVLVVAFISSRCEGCAGALERLSELAERRGDEGLRVFAISGRRGVRPQRALRRGPSRFQLLSDARGGVRQAWLGRNPDLPVMVVVDRDGLVRWVGKDVKPMLSAVERALRERNGVALD